MERVFATSDVSRNGGARELAVGFVRLILTTMHEPDRLAELRRQRALVQQHLEWLDAEIAAESHRDERDISPVGTPKPGRPVITRPVAMPTRSISSQASTPLDPLLGQQPLAASDVKQDVKKGCLLYFAAALAAVVVSVAILYFAFGVGRR